MHFKNPSEWDQKFSEESLSVEELLTRGDAQLLTQSKIRTALENNVISWDKYTNWLQETSTYPLIQSSLNSQEQDKLIYSVQENYKTFSHYEIWSEDLLPFAIWDNHLIILGLFPHEKLLAIPNSLFVLCPPELLKLAFASVQKGILKSPENIGAVLSVSNSKVTADIISGLHELDSNFHLNLSNLKLTDIDQTNPSIQIQPNISANYSSESSLDSTGVWTKIDQNHNQSTIIARKTFDAYVVLKIKDHKTSLYKMDEDLVKEKLAADHFEFDLNQANPLSEVLKNGLTSSISLSQLDITILDFKYACITPLKIGSQNVGFLVGFKASQLTEEDEKALESVSLLNAA